VHENVIIDGNNLLHAVRMLGPQRAPGRETLLRIIERWAVDSGQNVLLVFDGPPPRGGFGEQMRSSRIEVIFSESRTADDCIVERLEQKPRAGKFLVVSDDTAIQYEVRRQGCQNVPTTAFIALLFPKDSPPTPSDSAITSNKKPAQTSTGEPDNWLDLFDDGQSDEPFDGFDSMEH
jgi:predicted RNA-binding protein with PIN domain